MWSKWTIAVVATVCLGLVPSIKRTLGPNVATSVPEIKPTDRHVAAVSLASLGRDGGVSSVQRAPLVAGVETGKSTALVSRNPDLRLPVSSKPRLGKPHLEALLNDNLESAEQVKRGLEEAEKKLEPTGAKDLSRSLSALEKAVEEMNGTVMTEVTATQSFLGTIALMRVVLKDLLNKENDYRQTTESYRLHLVRGPKILRDTADIYESKAAQMGDDYYRDRYKNLAAAARARADLLEKRHAELGPEDEELRRAHQFLEKADGYLGDLAAFFSKTPDLADAAKRENHIAEIRQFLKAFKQLNESFDNFPKKWGEKAISHEVRARHRERQRQELAKAEQKKKPVAASHTADVTERSSSAAIGAAMTNASPMAPPKAEQGPVRESVLVLATASTLETRGALPIELPPVAAEPIGRERSAAAVVPTPFQPLSREQAWQRAEENAVRSLRERSGTASRAVGDGRHQREAAASWTTTNRSPQLTRLDKSQYSEDPQQRAQRLYRTYGHAAAEMSR